MSYHKDISGKRIYYRDDKTAYATKCLCCGGTWKIYQSPNHSTDCGKSDFNFVVVEVPEDSTCWVAKFGKRISDKVHKNWEDAESEIDNCEPSKAKEYVITTLSEIDVAEEVKKFTKTYFPNYKIIVFGQDIDKHSKCDDPELQNLINADYALDVSNGDYAQAYQLLTEYQEHGFINFSQYYHSIKFRL